MMISANLVLQSGECFPGLAPDWQMDHYFGEVVFATGMTGYVESLTDPSYAGQILVFTYPLIGNYGVPESQFWESGRLQAGGAIFTDLASHPSHRESKQTLLEWLKQESIPCLTGVDTRALTKHLRKTGTQLGAISRAKTLSRFFNPNGTNLLAKVSCTSPKQRGAGAKKVIVVDCGVKENILRNLSRFPLTLWQVPYDFDYSEEEFDGVFLSNGPGDPAEAKKTIAILQKALKRNKPVFGICLGAQIMALAIGASTYRLPFGHRGQNHPCLDVRRQRAILTAQNHGFAIDEKTLPEDWEATFISLNDRSVEGIAHKTLPFFSVQFHPESSPGPMDSAYLFDQFYEMML